MVQFYDVFGAFCVATVIFQLIRFVLPWIYQTFVGPNIFSVDFKKFGNWAVITGATDGIGREYARKFAKKGLNIVIISRSQIKLQKTAEEIEREFSVQVKHICVDFKNQEDIYERIERQISGLDIAVLVNNVGMSYANPEYFAAIPNHSEFVSNIVSCNIVSTLQMTKIVLGGMVQRKRGIIIMISSIAAYIPSPLLSVYSASKAFVEKFSQDLATEYESMGIIVQSVAPGPVKTNMSKIKNASWSSPTPETFVGSAIKTVIVSRSTTGYYVHSLMKMIVVNGLGLISPAVSRRLMLNKMQFLRQRAMGKIGSV